VVGLALLDPQLRRDLGIVAAYLRDEALGVLEADECLDGIAQRGAKVQCPSSTAWPRASEARSSESEAPHASASASPLGSRHS
jgi:hypothetical protein